MTDTTTVPVRPPRAGDSAGQPPRLAALALSELFERFAFFGMQTLLLLYLSETLLPAGASGHVLGLAALRAAATALAHPSTPMQTASLLVGLFGGMAYLAPIAGGWVADRLLGQRRTIVAGALLMSAGYMLLPFQPYFLVGMLLVIVGSGGFKGNIASEVSGLYGETDRRREQGFRLFFIAVNIGIIAAPMVCGSLAQAYGWRFGFMGAAIGMLASLFVYLLALGRSDRRRVVAAAARAKQAPAGPISARQCLAFALLLCLLATALLGSQQIYNAYLGWVHNAVALTVFGHRFPTAWLVTVDTGFSLLMLSITAPLWRFCRRYFPEPGELTKIAIGCWVVAASYGCLTLVRDGRGPGDVACLLAFHALNGFGYANIIPVAMALFARRAPSGARSTLIGLFYMQFAVAMFLAGGLGRLLGTMPSAAFWSLHAVVIGGAGVLVLACSGWIDRSLDCGPSAVKIASAAAPLARRRPLRTRPA